jgi:hypothetical protein
VNCVGYSVYQCEYKEKTTDLIQVTDKHEYKEKTTDLIQVTDKHEYKEKTTDLIQGFISEAKGL